MSDARLAGSTVVGPFGMLVANGLQDLIFQCVMRLAIRERAATNKTALHR